MKLPIGGIQGVLVPDLEALGGMALPQVAMAMAIWPGGAGFIPIPGGNGFSPGVRGAGA